MISSLVCQTVICFRNKSSISLLVSPSATIRPFSIIAKRWETSRTKRTFCSTKITVRPNSRLCLKITCSTLRPIIGFGKCKWRCCQTNDPKDQYSIYAIFYAITKERHWVRAASRLSLNVLRFESNLCELN